MGFLLNLEYNTPGRIIWYKLANGVLHFMSVVGESFHRRGTCTATKTNQSPYESDSGNMQFYWYQHSVSHRFRVDACDFRLCDIQCSFTYL